MTLSGDVLLAVCLGYVACLFTIAFVVDAQAARGRFRWLRSPVVYTLSISVYCTAWTFYGAVGSAARNGLEFITIYLGPTFVFVGWWFLLRKLVRIGRAYRITSIADLISSRFGKSTGLAVLVTVIAVTAITPYIALQLQSVTRSYQLISGGDDSFATAFWIATGLALFAILFGTRNLDANERHHGVVAAIAVEAVVKFVALFAVGIFVVVQLDGIEGIFGDVPAEVIYGGNDAIFDARWVAITFLSATAIICLPRQFQVTVIENVDERHLATASWLFPLYLFGMCLFIVPIAIAGLKVMPEGANPDLFVVSLPLQLGREELALLAFLGGFSSATSMVIVAAIAISTMVSNHIVMPIALRFMAQKHEVSGDVRNLVLTARRISIAAVLALGFLYFRVSGGDELARIGLIAFAGVAQFLPGLLGGLFWRGATRVGALWGLSGGGLLWFYLLFLPSFGGMLSSGSLIAAGPWGVELLSPYSFLGLRGLDPLMHALVWSLGVNILLFLVVSAMTEAGAVERLQAAQFVDIYRMGGSGPAQFDSGTARAEDLFVLAQRILGADPARELFDRMARRQGRVGLPTPDPAMIAALERELAGSVGAPSAHAMVGRVAGYAEIGVDALIDIADEAQRLIETSRALAEKSSELEQAATELRDANARLRRLDAQKDEFLSQVSHELRTPMTSIRSFAEILLDKTTEPEDRARFLRIIHDESQRLTRLLDEILDISRLESGASHLPVGPMHVATAIRSAVDAVHGVARSSGVIFDVATPPPGTLVTANDDRLRQVLINLLTNSVKYNTDTEPRITVLTHMDGRMLHIDVIDNGGGVTREEALIVFDKFARGDRAAMKQGAGLGLPISRAIMRTMGGDLEAVFDDSGGSFFRLTIPLTDQSELQPAE